MTHRTSEDDIANAVDRAAESDEEYRRKLDKARRQKKEGWLTQLVEWAAEKFLGGFLEELGKRVVQTLLGDQKRQSNRN